MPAVRSLPDGYQGSEILDLSSTSSSVKLNLAAIPLLFFYTWIFSLIFTALNPSNPFPNGLWSVLTSFSLRDWLLLLLCIVFILVFHELVHGMFFWIFTKVRPHFGLRGGYAYASAPDWYLPKYQYVVVGLSPFVVISLLGIILGSFLSVNLLPYLLVTVSFNAAGALGDMIVVAWILRRPNSILVKDEGDKFLTFDLQNS